MRDNEGGMKDFSFDIYKVLIRRLRKNGYSFQTFESFISNPLPKSVIIRHDIDLFATSAIPFIHIEKSLGVSASYYFRMRKGTFSPRIFHMVVAEGHELGYHYEDLARNNGDFNQAVLDFRTNLNVFRKFYPVRTVCMHGSSGSQYDNRDIWKQVDLAEFQLIGEPYKSIDFNQVLYLTDTSKRWNGNSVALRDKVDSSFTFSFSTTEDIISSINKLPDHVMLTIHPEYWADSVLGRIAVNSFVIAHSFYKKYYRNKRSITKAKKATLSE